MTQTLDQRARELLNKHLKSAGLGDDSGTRTLVHQRYVDAAEAALTEALTRVEELEGALKLLFVDDLLDEPMKENSAWRGEVSFRLDMARATLSKWITE